MAWRLLLLLLLPLLLLLLLRLDFTRVCAAGDRAAVPAAVAVAVVVVILFGFPNESVFQTVKSFICWSEVAVAAAECKLGLVVRGLEGLFDLARRDFLSVSVAVVIVAV